MTDSYLLQCSSRSVCYSVWTICDKFLCAKERYISWLRCISFIKVNGARLLKGLSLSIVIFFLSLSLHSVGLLLALFKLDGISKATAESHGLYLPSSLSSSLHSVEFLLLALFEFNRILKPLLNHMVSLCLPLHLNTASLGVDHMSSFAYPGSRQQSAKIFSILIS